LDFNEKIEASNLSQEKNIFKNQTDILDRQIDQLVYQLYGLTMDEIRIVKSGV
jgi:hypothetical protein